MNYEIKNEKIGGHKQIPWYSAIIKDALIWGTAYSMATTGAAYFLAMILGKEAISMGGIFLKTLMIFTPVGAVSGLLKWRLLQPQKTADRLYVITNQNTETVSSCSIHQKAA